MARAQRGAAVQRAGNAHRAAGVGAQRGQGHACAQSYRTAGGRAAGDAGEVVGVAHAEQLAGVERRVVAGGAEGQLVHVGLAQHDGAGLAQRTQARRVLARHEVGQRRGAGGGRQAGGVDVVLDHDGDAGQRLERQTGAARGVRRIGGGQRALRVEGDEGVQLAAGLGAGETGLDQLAAAQAPRAEGVERLGDGQVGGAGSLREHGQFHGRLPAAEKESKAASLNASGLG
ncbi:hypothetical protein D3C78_668020 [compost metagenome]